MIDAAIHSRRLGARAPRSLMNAYKIPPAITNRTPAIRKGGIVSIANRMPRYVDPQMT